MGAPSSIPPKVIDIPSGKLMVVTDLHGNWKDYRQALDNFKTLRKQGEADTLIFLGDLIHRRNPEKDESVKILSDLINRGANEPGSNILAVLGNHEMVHIYHIELWRGPECFTQPFEDAVRGERAPFIEFMMDMPFALRTAGGVLLNHSGPSGIVGMNRQSEYGVDFQYLCFWNHRKLVRKAQARARIHGDWDPFANFHPRVGLAFTSKKKGVFLWEFLMNKNENRYHLHYDHIVTQYLDFMSEGLEKKLKVMVNGHIQVPEGIKIVSKGQLRLSSGFGAKNNSYKTYILLNAEKEYEDAESLATKCRAMYA